MILRMRGTRCMILGILRIKYHTETRLSHLGREALWLWRRLPVVLAARKCYADFIMNRKPWR